MDEDFAKEAYIGGSRGDKIRLMNKILLFTPVVGTHFYEGKKNLGLFAIGESVMLIRDPANKYDPFAVCVGVTVFDSDGAPSFLMLGHIPKKDVAYSQIIATLLANGIKLSAVVIRCEPGTQNPVSIQISLTGASDDA